MAAIGLGVVMSMHHLVGKAQGGDDLFDNIVPLCGSGNVGCHGIYTTHASEWVTVAMRIRATLTDAEASYIVRKKSQAWLDRHYPLELQEAA